MRELSVYHERTRERGVNAPVYWVARAVLQPSIQLWFRIRRERRERVPAEGTRVRRGPLGEPRRGVGRLALETGAPVVPVAVAGTERVRRGWVIRPRRVRIRIGRPLTFPVLERPSQHLASEVTARVWPCVELHWAWLGGQAERGLPAAPAAREPRAA